MAIIHDIGKLSERTLRFEHFSFLRPSPRQLCAWVAATRPKESDAGLASEPFSPFEFLALCVFRCLKDVSNRATPKNLPLVEFLSSEDNFGRPAVAIWADGNSPILITDFKSRHRLVPATRDTSLIEFGERDYTFLAHRLAISVEATMDAINRGGTPKQIAIAERLRSCRQAMLVLARAEGKMRPLHEWIYDTNDTVYG